MLEQEGGSQWEKTKGVLEKAHLRWGLTGMFDMPPGSPGYRQHSRRFMPLAIPLGICMAREQRFEWRPGLENNGILLVTGASGSGKTEALKLIGSSIIQHGIPLITIDFHGDLDVQWQTVKVLSGGLSAQAGVNPLSLEPESILRTGLRGKIERELDRIGRAIGKLSYKQKSCLSTVMSDAYRDRGIMGDLPSTWGYPPPTLSDMAQILMTAIRSGMEGFESNTLQACYQKISLLAGCPAFQHSNCLNVETMKDWSIRLDCRDLSRPAQVLAAETVLEMIFEAERARGPIPVSCASDADRFRVFVMVDEAKILTLGRGDVSRADHIVNILATEGRKYGIGLILASQVSNHFGDEAHANAASRLVMKRMDYKEARRVAPDIGVRPEEFLDPSVPGDGYFYSQSVGGLVELSLDRAGR